MGASDHGIRLRSSARTSIGQVRENNEDNIRLWMDDEFAVAVVADGMGGAVAGEEASRIAVETLQQGKFLQPPDDTPLNLTDDQAVSWLTDSIRAANANIVRKASLNPELRGMGTTMTLAFVRESRAIVAHVGDSRAYLVDGNTRRITQITADHSFVEALVAAGHLTHEQAEEHPMRNVLYRALGQNDEVDVDIYETRLRPGDRLVLCSDGLTRHVKALEIANIVSENDDPEVASQMMIDMANARGGEDNVSVIIVSIDGLENDEDTDELKRVVLLDDELLITDHRGGEHRGSTIEIDISDTDTTLSVPDSHKTLRINGSNVATVQTNSAPNSDGHDNRTPDQ